MSEFLNILKSTATCTRADVEATTSYRLGCVPGQEAESADRLARSPHHGGASNSSGKCPVVAAPRTKNSPTLPTTPQQEPRRNL